MKRAWWEFNCFQNGNSSKYRNYFTEFLPISKDFAKEEKPPSKNYPQKLLPKTTSQKSKKQNIEFDEKEYKNVIIKFIKENNNITKNDIAEKLGITKDGVKYHLKKLVKDGYIKYVGTSKKGYWKILKLYWLKIRRR